MKSSWNIGDNRLWVNVKSGMRIIMVPIRYFVVKCGGQWRVEFDNKHWNGFKSVKEAIHSAIEAARKTATADNQVEVLVQSENKIWHTEWSSMEEI